MKTNVRMYSFQYMVFTIFYHSFNTPDVLCTEAWSLCFHEAMLSICNKQVVALLKVFYNYS